jgi:hypothetical protein
MKIRPKPLADLAEIRESREMVYVAHDDNVDHEAGALASIERAANAALAALALAATEHGDALRHVRLTIERANAKKLRVIATGYVGPRCAERIRHVEADEAARAEAGLTLGVWSGLDAKQRGEHVAAARLGISVEELRRMDPVTRSERLDEASRKGG